MRDLYPPIDPYRTGRLKVSGLHELYFEECGNPQGKPVVFLHGGPGGGIDAKHRRYFDPKAYRIVLFDQRGCGQSTPFATLEENTTWHLVGDIEALRVELGIDRWQVFGGSWGSTLALAYAESYPERVTELVLRGIFLLRQSEIDWSYQNGAGFIYPDAWEKYLEPISLNERHDMVNAYHRRLMGPDAALRQQAASAWSIWEGSISKLVPDSDLIARFGSDHFALALARIECHYFVNHGFLRADNQLIDEVHRIRNIPGVIIQGRYDIVCPMQSAWDLHRAWPEADLRIVADAGHSASEPGIISELVSATDRFR